jgi:hypothetical protein
MKTSLKTGLFGCNAGTAPSDAADPHSLIPATPYVLFAGAGLFDVWLYRPGEVLGRSLWPTDHAIVAGVIRF